MDYEWFMLSDRAGYAITLPRQRDPNGSLWPYVYIRCGYFI